VNLTGGPVAVLGSVYRWGGSPTAPSEWVVPFDACGPWGAATLVS
jgi:hypothetical protein